MNQLQHIKNNKDNLISRAQIVKSMREFFWSKNFTEVETPNIVALPGQEPYLSPMSLKISDENKKQYQAYLHTSPEYAMKKMLAGGFDNIFSICKCFRDNESFGGLHNPEFTMIEWYRTEVDFYKIMDDVEDLIQNLKLKIQNKNSKFQIPNSKFFEKIHMRDLWKKYAGIDLDEYLEKEKMFTLCVERGFNPDKDEKYEDLFYRIFLNEIEPKLKDPVIIHHYPAQMAALAKLSDEDNRYAERFEVYVNGMEIANAFSELTDEEEQRKRLVEEKELRKELGKPRKTSSRGVDVFEIDEDFIEAVGELPKCAGIALGVDRLVQVFLSCQNIDDVLVLPASIILSPDHLTT
ncbi:MAG: EF-P lysine aminoacylase GenX [Candidatus Magasanikbacteria bacterium RIFOXYC2_FULL_40_16]|uniref:EF-P lysine aminoacylase GenX n=3 Tax=Candidatus Magasanikiibacteriota TaxID=1752731 RepID=A0A1F6ND91_9BACT|nr:MAG: EF-P lysine aminoacylase GenX [Candidatus Magasanikbacteria bacterium RIFOXYA2_FULL_40_20]OGH81906.1 MAG: EF-P lysine aminoacylase GenX [Candidatus Magasanikbacteria bacterium RIFOXYB1_FULL_40_15]OGH87332.1 MAG: EF-P lysine aminoacylase GenX [Candidatus Magasanikbacteria bacterium RIFOXYA1_FULL_40_8]OGH89342.1 MAG: EF-P lysine aminoacylase GenX [Candidatus Magasanikbacteria bacterium RIFOXYC2_FULL_40_16]